jgi:hypothetical protein
MILASKTHEMFRFPSPMSKILDGVAWLAASHGSTVDMCVHAHAHVHAHVVHVVVVIIIRIWVATIGLRYGFRQESRLLSGSPSDLRYSTHYTRYEIHTLSSTRLGPAGHAHAHAHAHAYVHAHMHVHVRVHVSKKYGMVRPRGVLEDREREALGRGLECDGCRKWATVGEMRPRSETPRKPAVCNLF